MSNTRLVDFLFFIFCSISKRSLLGDDVNNVDFKPFLVRFLFIEIFGNGIISIGDVRVKVGVSILSFGQLLPSFLGQ